jgi:alkylhydroperoxidase/carboxymuconolactone decarboxylase family protein YurZ
LKNLTKAKKEIEMIRGFSKKIFTAGLFFRHLGFLVWNAPKIIRVYTNKQNRQLIGKIVIVIDAVNECIYCSWLDAKLAVKEGISEEEIKNMLKLQFHEDASESELNALLFTQHYAESNGNPYPEMTRGFFEFYGENTAKDIIIAIKTVTFGNLYFSTWRAVVSRFKGNSAPDSNVVFEIVFFY